jgi:hypothetical protein
MREGNRDKQIEISCHDSQHFLNVDAPSVHIAILSEWFAARTPAEPKVVLEGS